jgi:hypothetical protein
LNINDLKIINIQLTIKSNRVILTT